MQIRRLAVGEMPYAHDSQHRVRSYRALVNPLTGELGNLNPGHFAVPEMVAWRFYEPNLLDSLFADAPR